MLKGVNDKPEHARQLIRLMRRLPAKVNLIPFNPFPGTRYARPDEDTIRADCAQSIDANAVHGSDSLENAAIETAYFFSATELCPR